MQQLNERIGADQGFVGPSSGVPWRIPEYVVGKHSSYREYIETAKANKYLRGQYRRYTIACAEQNYWKAMTIIVSLMGRSRSFQVYMFNRVAHGWYWKFSEEKIHAWFGEMRSIMRTWDTNLVYSRIYIPKEDGRFRPVGVPTLPWRVINVAFTDLIYDMTAHHISVNQFGFRRGRSIMDAWKKIWEDKGRSHIFEFDLEGCFNRIDRQYLSQVLAGYDVPTPLRRYIERVNRAMPIIDMETLKEETEVQLMEKNWIRKNGMPQGLPWSPICSILVIDKAFKEIGLDPILYADDGILLSKTKFDMWKYDRHLRARGLILSKRVKNGEAVCRWVDGPFTFLGLTWWPSKDLIYKHLIWYNRTWMTESSIKRLVWEGYTNNSSMPLRWDTDEKSFMATHPPAFNLIWWIIHGYYFFWLEKQSPFIRKGFRLYCIQAESSRSCNELLKWSRRKWDKPCSFTGKFMSRDWKLVQLAETEFLTRTPDELILMKTPMEVKAMKYTNKNAKYMEAWMWQLLEWREIQIAGSWDPLEKLFEWYPRHKGPPARLPCTDLERQRDLLQEASALAMTPRVRMKLLQEPFLWDNIVGDAQWNEEFREINKRLRRAKRLYSSYRIFHA